MDINNHMFFTDKEIKFLRSLLGEYAEVIRPSDIFFIMEHTGVCWDTVLKHFAFNDGDINKTLIELQR